MKEKSTSDNVPAGESPLQRLDPNALVSAVVLDADGRLSHLGPAIEPVLGYRPEDVLGDDAFSYVHHEDLAAAAAAFAEILERPAVPVFGELRARRPDGSFAHLEVVGTNLLHDPTVRGIVVNAHDVSERKLAEERRGEAEARYRALVEQLPLVTYVAELDESSSAVYLSPQCEEILGYSVEEWLTDRELFRKILHPDDCGRVLAEIASARESGQDFRSEYRLIARDGRVVWFRDESVGVKDESGRPFYAQGYLLDITERKEAEAALRRREAILEAVSAGAERFLRSGTSDEDIPEILASLGRAANVSRVYLFENHVGEDDELMVSQRYEWTAEHAAPEIENPELQSLPYSRCLSRWPDVLGVEQRPLQLHVRECPEQERQLHASQGIKSLVAVPIVIGEQWWGYIGFDECRAEREWSAVEIDALKAAAGILGAVIERRKVEQALRSSEERFREMAENIGEVFWMSSLDLSELFYVSPAYEQIWGLSCESAYREPRSFLDTVHPEDRPRVTAAVEELADRGYDLEYRVIRPDGSVRWVRDRAFQIRNERGEVYRITGIVTDVTEHKRAAQERRRLEEQIQHAQKLESLGVLAGGIAHDFNNLLMGVLGNAGLALAELPPESPSRPLVEHVETAALRAAELTNQMLAYAGKGKFVVQTLDLSRLVEEIAHLLDTAISKKAVLRYELGENLPPIEGDAAQLRQVVMNLITNASEALASADGVIAVTTGVVDADRAYLADTFLSADLAEGSYVQLEVSDTGSGMDVDTKAKIFDPFFTTKFTGRGLGLAAVLGIVRAHNGAIKVQSEPGRGTTFNVIFPCASTAHGAGRSESPQAQVSADGRTVLVVDDEETVRSVTREALERSGFNVLTASDGLEAVRTFRKRSEEIAAVLLDMTMPQMDGEETFVELRRIRPDARVILSSGYSEEETTARFAKQGIAGFIQKPYRPAALVEKLAEVLATSPDKRHGQGLNGMRGK